MEANKPPIINSPKSEADKLEIMLREDVLGVLARDDLLHEQIADKIKTPLTESLIKHLLSLKTEEQNLGLGSESTKGSTKGSQSKLK